ncbi:YkgJ family cysteine cluster protein [Methanocella sp. MCL-LM]|uniref:YkgJ family cysteine cluster protein n=1 Tax=Methanocella sp. MCL-LM TaxID=3412035 RepID=UPI003C707EF3
MVLTMTEEAPFECAMCGRCCSQRLILLNTEDVFRMADHFKIPVPQFMEKHGVVFATTGTSKTPRLYLQISGDVCPFFKDGCSIHEIKPLMCKLFPVLKPGQTAGEIKAFIKKHAHSEGVLSCKMLTLPDNLRLAVDREAMITSVIYDSMEIIYYSNLERKDMQFVRSLLKALNRDQLRAIVSDYLFNGSKESGLVFEQAMFEMQALCQIADWKKVPYLVAHEGVAMEPGKIYVLVSPEDARRIYNLSLQGEVESVISNTNPSVADPECTFISVAMNTKGDNGLMLAFPAANADLRNNSTDGHVSLCFYPADGSMDDIGAVKAYIDPNTYK